MTLAEVTTKSFISSSYDKFTDKETINMVWPKGLDNFFHQTYEINTNKYSTSSKGYNLTLEFRHVKAPHLDALVLDYVYVGADWGFVKDGQLILNVDGKKNIVLTPVESDSKTESYKVLEVGYYNISPEVMKAICTAKVLEMKITGKEFTLVRDNSVKPLMGLSYPEKFLFMARAFAMGIYNDDTYMSQVKSVLATEAAEENTTKKQRLIIGAGVFMVFFLLFLMVRHFSRIDDAYDRAHIMEPGDATITINAHDTIKGHIVSGYKVTMITKDKFCSTTLEYYSRAQLNKERQISSGTRLSPDSLDLMIDKTRGITDGGTIWVTAYETDKVLADMYNYKIIAKDTKDRQIVEHTFDNRPFITLTRGYMGYGAVHIPEKPHFPFYIYVSTIITDSPTIYKVTPVLE